MSGTSLPLAVALFVTSLSAAAQTPHYYVPLVNAIIATDRSLASQTRWVSNLAAFNRGQTTASVEMIAVYGGWSLIPGGRTYALPPSTGVPIDRWPWDGGDLYVASSTPGPLALAEVVADPSIILNAGVEKVYLEAGCYGSVGSTPVSQGRAAIPVFRGLFPANSTVVCGDINLGEPEQTCGSPPQAYLRRVNVTLFNGGDQDADFVITAIPFRSSPDPLYQQTVTLAPKEVRQLNKVPIPVVRNLTTENGYFDVSVWVTISAPQPFIAYVSSVFEGGVSGSIPMEVFAPRLAVSGQ